MSLKESFQNHRFFFFFLFEEFWQLQVWSSMLHETDWNWKEFWHDDGKSNSVISVIWRKEVNVCDRVRESSFNSTAKMYIGAEVGEVLHNNLTTTCQINYVVSVIRGIGRFEGWVSVILYRGAVQRKQKSSWYCVSGRNRLNAVYCKVNNKYMTEICVSRFGLKLFLIVCNLTQVI